MFGNAFGCGLSASAATAPPTNSITIELLTRRGLISAFSPRPPHSQLKNRERLDITVVLVGSETWKRKHVDWEIYATLAKKHALLGIVLPTHSKNHLGEIIVPDRLLDNVASGFASWIHWSNDATTVSNAVTHARQLAKTPARIVNSRQQLGRNLS